MSGLLVHTDWLRGAVGVAAAAVVNNGCLSLTNATDCVIYRTLLTLWEQNIINPLYVFYKHYLLSTIDTISLLHFLDLYPSLINYAN